MIPYSAKQGLTFSRGSFFVKYSNMTLLGLGGIHYAPSIAFTRACSLYFIMTRPQRDSIPAANERRLSAYGLGIVYIEDGIITGVMLVSNTISVKICES